jgi:hypothetical protein
LFQFAQLNLDRADPATKEVLRYQSALKEGFQSLGHHPLTMRTAVSVCSRIKDQNMNIRKVPGTQLRTAQKGETLYSPPQGETLLHDLLSNWERFLHNLQFTTLALYISILGGFEVCRCTLISRGLPSSFVWHGILFNLRIFNRALVAYSWKGHWQDYKPVLGSSSIATLSFAEHWFLFRLNYCKRHQYAMVGGKAVSARN